MIALTRIFALTQDYQNLNREITTPSLPAFIPSCLNLIAIRVHSQEVRKLNVYSPLLEVVLQSLIKLLPHHPSLFRPFVTQIRNLLLPLLASTPSQNDFESASGLNSIAIAPSTRAVYLSHNLYILLSCCSPKNTAGEEWIKTLRTLMTHIHGTADLVFRAVFEDWDASIRTSGGSVNSKRYGEIVSNDSPDLLNLPGWKGIYAGNERLLGLLQLLRNYVLVFFTSPVTLPVGHILGITERVLSIPAPGKAGQNSVQAQARLNPEIGRDEREGLWSGLTEIHIATLEILSALLSRLGGYSMTISHVILERLIWVFQRGDGSPRIRSSSYHLLSQILGVMGPSMSGSTVSSLSPLISSCCKDLLDGNDQMRGTNKKRAISEKLAPNSSLAANNVDAYLASSSQDRSPSKDPTNVERAAEALLPLFLSNIPTSSLKGDLRSQIDRVAVLTGSKRAMLTSVLNPPTKGANRNGTRSILPLLSRAHPEAPEVEALILPRMPLILHCQDRNGDFELEEDGFGMSEDNHTEQYSLHVPSYVRAQGDNGTREMSNDEYEQRSDNIAVEASSTLAPKERLRRSASESNSLASQPLFLEESNKRTRDDREEIKPTSPPGTINAAATPALNLKEPLNKRQRLDEDIATDTAPIISSDNTAHREIKVISAPATIETTIGGNARNVAKTAVVNPISGSDDDDDFEIPPIDPTMDSDLDSDEDEEEI